MTVAALTPSIEYLEDGATLDFAVPFRFLDGSDFAVTRVEADGTVTDLAAGLHYSASGGESDAGGTLTLVSSVAGARLRIERDTPREQSTDYATGDRFPAESHELALDRAMLIDQEQDVEIADTAARALRVPRGETIGDLPAEGDRAGGFLAFDADGEPQVLPGTGTDMVLPLPASQVSKASGGSVQGLITTLEGTGAAAALQTKRARTLQAEVELRASVDLSPIFLDMYWEFFHGVGWSPYDPGDGSVQYGSTFSAAAALNATSVQVADGQYFFAGQSITHQASDGDYYTNVVYSKSGTAPATLQLCVPLKAAVSNGGLIGVTYNDYNHPREYGRRAIADFIVRKLTAAGLRKRRKVAAQYDWDTLYPVTASGYDAAAATITAYNTLNYGNPGSDFARMWAALVTPAAIGGDGGVNHGAASFPVALDRMTGEVEVLVNPLAVAGGMHTLQCFLTEEGPGPSDDLAAPGASVLVTGRDCVQKVVIPFSKGHGTRLRLWVRSTTGNPFRVGARRFYETEAAVQDLTTGPWAMASDSWNANAGLPEITTRLTAKLPLTQQSNASVSGNKSQDVLDRFDATIAPLAPHVLLGLFGTNDWAQGVARTVYGGNVQDFIRRSIAIGAQPVILGPSVGSTEDMDANPIAQLQTSRAYVCSMEHEWSRVHDNHVLVESQWNRGAITIAAGARIGLLVCTEATAGGFWLEHMNWSAEVPAVQMRIGFASTLGPGAPAGTLTDEIAFSSPAAAGTAEKTRVWIPKSDLTTARFAWVIAVNTDASDRTLNFFQAKASVWPAAA